MKIRTSFVTNSSSYSSAEIRIDNPVLLEILKQYKQCNTFGDSYVSGYIGQKVKGKELAWKLSESEVADIFFAPKNTTDVLRCLIDIMDESVSNADSYDKVKYNEMKLMLKSKEREISSSYADIYWQAENNSYGEDEPDNGDEVEWSYHYIKSTGIETRDIIYKGGNEAKEERDSRLKAEEEQERISRQEDNTISWLGEYESYFDDVKEFCIKNKNFVFTGLRSTINLQEQYQTVINKIEEMGGYCRSKVSGKTDYLIVYPGGAGDTKINSALEQKRQGSYIKIALWDNLVSYLENPLLSLHMNDSEIRGNQSNTRFPDATEDIAHQKQNIQEVLSVDTKKTNQEGTDNGFDVTSYSYDENNGQTTKVNPSNKVINDFEYVIFDCREVWIKKYNGKEKKVTIPSELEYMPVTTIGSYAFESNTEVTEVELPPSIITISTGSFHRCKNLSVINFPEKLETIERSAFSDCTSLTSVVLPSSLRILQGDVFKGCRKLTSITLPSKLDTVFKNNFPSIKSLILIVPPSSPMERWVKENGFQYKHVGQGTDSSEQTDGNIEDQKQKYKEIEQRIAELRVEVRDFAEKLRADTERINKNSEDTKRLQTEILQLTNEYNGITGWFKGRQRKEILERIEAKKAELKRLEEERFS